MKSEEPTPGSTASDTKLPKFGGALLRAAWLAILLGFAMEVVLLSLLAGFGDLPGLRTAVADFARNISWAVFVCVGLAVGRVVSEVRTPAMGLLGLLAAPLAFEISRVFHKGTKEALAVAGAESGVADASPILLALIKGVEYGCLGLAIGWISTRHWGGLRAHVAVGLVIGLVFGSAILGIMLGSSSEPLPAVELLTRSVNEILFPVGCALVLFSAGALAEKVSDKDSS